MRFSGVLVGLSVYQATASDRLTRSLIVHSTALIPKELPQENTCGGRRGVPCSPLEPPMASTSSALATSESHHGLAHPMPVG
jgi:hypothetical protein